MVNNVIVANFGQPPTRFQGKAMSDEFSSGIALPWNLTGGLAKLGTITLFTIFSLHRGWV